MKHKLSLLYKTSLGACVGASMFLGAAQASAQQSVEVLHWWTSGGEAAALNVLKEDLQSKGVSWTDMPVAGGGGEQAMTVLAARVVAGDAPTAVQMLGFDILEWAEQGQLADLNQVAAKGNWDTVVPKALQRFAKHDGKWISAPVNVHSTNWVWANKKMLDGLGIKQPQNWNDFVAALKKVKASGKVALAHGGQAWQDATMFDGVVMSVGGPDFYRKAFIDLNEKSLSSDTMVKAFERMAVLRAHVDDNFSGRDWNLASAMVINDEAAFQIMGDWAKGEFLRAGKVPGKDFLCFRVPGSAGTVTFNSDQFAMFKVASERRGAQNLMAEAVMNPTFQSAFNVVKGSVPARTDVSDRDFDACGKQGMRELAAANEKGTLFGSMAHGHAAPAAVKNAVYDVVTAHFNGEYGAKEAAKKLATAVADAK